MIDIFISHFQKYSWILVVLILLYGWFSPLLAFITFVCMIGPVIFAFSYGRAWCGNFCPRGSFNNVVLSKISFKNNIPWIYKNTLFRLIMFIILMTLFAANLLRSNGTMAGIGIAFVKMMLITTIIQVFVGILIHPNAWCTFCPMGTAAAFITWIRGSSNINIGISDKCVGCALCKEKCPMELSIPQWKNEGKIKDIDCLKCRKCIETCPKKALTITE